jgi:predicted restriction endonuclease
LYSIPEAFGLALWGECGNTVGLFNSALDEEATSELIREAQEIIAGSAPTRTEVRQLIAARLGQGWFKKEVQQLEPRCRLTGVAEPTLLIASHMKPWRSSNNTERLTGANGLLLSPHVDRLFDRGLITFRDDGSLVTSPALSREVTSRWHINGAPYGGAFKEDQKPFLEYHRDEIFQSSTVS